MRHQKYRCEYINNSPINEAQVFHTSSGPEPSLPLGLDVAAAAVVVVAFSDPPLKSLDPLAADSFLSTRLPMLHVTPYSSMLEVTSETE